MAFYQDQDKKSKEEKKRDAEARGGFDDEGTRYSGSTARGPRTGRGAKAPAQAGQQGRQGESRVQRSTDGEAVSQKGTRATSARTGAGRASAASRGRQGSAPAENASAENRAQGGSPQRLRAGAQARGQSTPRDNAAKGNATQNTRNVRNTRVNDTPNEGVAMQQRPAPQRSAAPRATQGTRQGSPRPTDTSAATAKGRGQSVSSRNASRAGSASTAPTRNAPSTQGRSSSPNAPRTGGRTNAPTRGRNDSFAQSGNATRSQSGKYRFVTGSAQLYQERGAGMAPRAQRFGPSGDYHYDAPPAYDAPSFDGADAVPLENLLSGRNPIREALKSGRDIEKLLVARGELSGSAREIVQMAKERHIPVQEVDRTRLDAITINHQGMLAFASAYQYRTVEDMLALAKEKNEAPFLVLLDGITDPHNLGAIIRTAECAGAHGVIVQERRAVGLTPAAVKASAGAVEYLPVARVTNLTQTVKDLKKRNIWVFAADMEGEDYATVDFSGPLALVIGGEGEGVSRLVLDACDRRVALPIRGQLESLNASVAAGILLYTAMRAR